MLQDADRKAEAVVDRAHPLRVTLGEVVVHRDEVGALAGEGVEIDGERGDERLAFTGLHLGDLALVEHRAAEDLHVEVAQADAATGGFAHGGERLGQDVVQRLAVREPLTELVGVRGELFVGQRRHLVRRIR